MVTGENYLDLLHELKLELENNPLYQDKELILQQDGAPPYFQLAVCAYLDENFPDRLGGAATQIG